MFFFPRSLRRRWILRRKSLDEGLWRETIADLPHLAGFDADEESRLRELVLLFLHEKAIEAVGEQVVDERMRMRIAALACLPILNLGLDYYRGWYSVVVYPGGFIARHEQTDEAGAVHVHAAPLVGEAWEQGPVILSWEDIEHATQLDGYNVALHEFAHKLDMLWEGPNGLPPLHSNMPVQAWSVAFSDAFDDHCRAVDNGDDTALDPYAAESPGEFFAVVTEAFFEVPEMLRDVYPSVYEQLMAFYRQDPLRRLGRVRVGEASELADEASPE